MIQIELSAIEPHQYNFVYSNKRYVLNSGGVGSGKSYGIVLRTLQLAINNPKIFILIGAQTYPLLRDTTLREFLNVVSPLNIIKSYNQTQQHFILFNGSEIIFRSFDDANKLKSLNLGACGIEEMTDIPEDIFKMLRTRLRQNNMPCCLYGATNPSTFNNWVYKYFIETPIENSEVIYSISSDNFYLPAEYLKDLETIKISNPEYYDRMVMGKWGALEGLVYNLPMTQRIERLCQKEEARFKRYIAGLDFGFTHPTALVIAGCTDETYYIVDEIYQHKMTSGDIIDKIKEKMQQYNIDIIYADSSRPEIIEDCQRAGLPVVDAIKDVWDGIMHVKTLINTQKLYVYNTCFYALRDFDSYIWDVKNTVKEQPLKINDDMADAIRYMLFSDRRNLGGADFSEGTERDTARMDW